MRGAGNGQLTTIGNTGVSATPAGNLGLDVAPGGTVYALLRVGTTRLYTVNPVTGAATLVGAAHELTRSVTRRAKSRESAKIRGASWSSVATW